MKKRITLFGLLVAALALVWLIFGRDGEPGTEVEKTSSPPRPPAIAAFGENQPRQKKRTLTDGTTGAQPSRKMSRELVAGGREWMLKFADQSLPPAIQQRIIFDLNLVFGQMFGQSGPCGIRSYLGRQDLSCSKHP
jgi:hypothetical protein